MRCKDGRACCTWLGAHRSRSSGSRAPMYDRAPDHTLLDEPCSTVDASRADRRSCNSTGPVHLAAHFCFTSTSQLHFNVVVLKNVGGSCGFGR
eukprot:5773167-Prymnesium_polylepis.2